MTIHVPRWVVWALSAALTLAALAAVFLLGRSTGDGDAPDRAATTSVADVQPATCSRRAAEEATLQTDFADAIRRTGEVQSEFAGYKLTPIDFFTKNSGDYQVAVLECRDLTGDDVEDMVVGIGAGASGTVFQWAIFTPDSDGHWELAFHREPSSVRTIRVSGDVVVVQTPTYALNEPLCCPSGSRRTEVGYEAGQFEVVSPVASERERLIEVSDDGVTRLGAFRPQTDSSVQAFADFGTPTSITQDSDELCVYEWSDLGLTINFVDLGGQDPCGPDGRVGTIELLGTSAETSGWRTSEGLSVGMPVDEARGLYPGAREQGGELVLVEQPSPIGDSGTAPVVTAHERDGIIVALRLQIGAAGE